ncbi:unnamed protein product, partial [Rotaria sp. Silwood2]
MKKLSTIEQVERKHLGEAINLVKLKITNLLEAKQLALEDNELAKRFIEEKIDLTIPARTYKQGSIHPITQVTEELIQIFAKFGLNVQGGPTIENDWSNLKVVLAKIGCEIPKGKVKIKESIIRGEKSCGMLCSAGELLVGADSEGIIELPDSAEIGESFIKYYGLDDPVININVTPNRGDALGVYGIARDLATRGIGRLKTLTPPIIKEEFQSELNLKIQDKAA